MCAICTVEANGIDRRFAGLSDEVVLKVQRAFIGFNAGANPVVGHRQDIAGDAKFSCQSGGDLAERLAGRQPPGALDVHRQIGIAEPKPGLAAELAERLHETPGFVATTPAVFLVDQVGEGVDQGVDIGRYLQPEVFEIVAGVDDQLELAGRHQSSQTCRQFRAADAAGQCHQGSPGHWNRSSLKGLIRALLSLNGEWQGSP
ncbi:hypothetical protein D3C78_751050 [compost metagenome]